MEDQDARPKKILILSQAYYPKYVGGAEVAIKAITDRLDPSEYEFHMVTNRFDSTLPKQEQVENVLVHRIGFTKKCPSIEELRQFPLHFNKLLFQFLAYNKARKLHRLHDYDAIWAMMAHTSGIPAARFKKRHPEVTYVLTLQEGDAPEHIERKMRIFGGFFKKAFARADVLQSISRFLEQWGMRMGFSGHSVVIPNAVDIKHFTQSFSEEEIKATQEKLNKQPDDVLLVTTSRLVKKNGLDDVIRALPRLPERVKFIVFGTGPEEDTLKKLVRECELEDRVDFRGAITHEEMPRYLKACDIFIRPSRSEGMGISFIEAMMAGLPVVATQVGGISDFLFDPKRDPEKAPTGFAVPKNDPEAIAERITSIIDGRAPVDEVVTNAQNLVREHYDWDHITAQMKTNIFSHL